MTRSDLLRALLEIGTGASAVTLDKRLGKQWREAMHGLLDLGLVLPGQDRGETLYYVVYCGD